MHVPNSIKVHVTSDEGADESGIIIQMTVTTGQKNPYYVYFPKTDSAGIATLTRDDFIGQFKDHWESGLMDHAGTPEDADSRVLVTLYDPSWAIANRELALAWPLLKHERTKWPSREEEYRSRVSSRNRDFIATPLTVDLHQTQNFVYPITKKVVEQGR
jgi:hypothetical protein